MASIVYITSRAPAKLTDDLILAGHRAWECLSVSEALYLCETEQIDVIVIGADVEEPNLVQAQLHYITVRMKPDATAKDLIWELTMLFPGARATVQ